MFHSPTRLALAATIITSTMVSGTPLYRGSTTTTSAPYTLIADYSGSAFFDHFTAFTGPDPTHGDVVYVDMETAQASNLIQYKNTSGTSYAIIGVDHSTVTSSGRSSVRLTSKQTFSPYTLSILDVRHIPVQWGVWPAVWFLGDLPGGTWPASNGGESDWLEWVHKSPYNSMTLHTGPGCSVQNDSSPATSFQGTLLNSNCNAGQGSEGCSIAAYSGDSSSSPSVSSLLHSSPVPTAGDAFNSAGGAIYAHLWTPDGVTIWMFPHDAVPAELSSATTPESTNGASSLDPESWLTTHPPLARVAGPGCDFTRALQDLQLIINIDFCGDWAGQPEIWASSGAQAATGVSTCSEFVGAHPEAFADTYFEIASLKFYSANAKTGADRVNESSIVYANSSGDPLVFSNQTAASNFTRSNSSLVTRDLRVRVDLEEELESARVKVSQLTTAVIIFSLIVGLALMTGVGFAVWRFRNRDEWS